MSDKLNRRGAGGIPTYNYWTNFSRTNNEYGMYEVLEYDPEIEGYWWFKTNIDKEYMDTNLSVTHIRTFLFAMLEEYKGRQ